MEDWKQMTWVRTLQWLCNSWTFYEVYLTTYRTVCTTSAFLPMSYFHEIALTISPQATWAFLLQFVLAYLFKCACSYTYLEMLVTGVVRITTIAICNLLNIIHVSGWFCDLIIAFNLLKILRCNLHTER